MTDAEMAADDEYYHGGRGMAYVLLYLKLKQQPQGPKTEGSQGPPTDVQTEQQDFISTEAASGFNINHCLRELTPFGVARYG